MTQSRWLLHRLLVVTLTLTAWPAPAGWAQAELVVFSARKEELIRPVVEAFERETGIKPTLLTGKAGELARRIELEQNDAKGDVFVGTTAGVTEQLREKGLLLSYRSPYAKEVPSEFRAPDHTWIGITGRVRVIIYNKSLVPPDQAPRSFFELTDPKWKNKVTIASMGERTTVGHLAAIMVVKGEEFTKAFVQKLKENGLKVLNNNTDVRKAVARGEYAIGITNHYYYMLQLQEDPKSPIGIVYPDQGLSEMGSPVFSITAAIIKGAKHADAAKRFLDFLLQPKGARLLVEGEFEIPLTTAIRPTGEEKGIRGLGMFKRTPLTQMQIADLEPKVEKLLGPMLVP
jgi:iron(III) transport system substrate-binding protein